MSKSHEAKRGVQSARCHYGIDESKTHPSLLDAIPDEELESIEDWWCSLTKQMM